MPYSIQEILTRIQSQATSGVISRSDLKLIRDEYKTSLAHKRLIDKVLNGTQAGKQQFNVNSDFAAFQVKPYTTDEINAMVGERSRYYGVGTGVGLSLKDVLELSDDVRMPENIKSKFRQVLTFGGNHAQPYFSKADLQAVFGVHSQDNPAPVRKAGVQMKSSAASRVQCQADTTVTTKFRAQLSELKRFPKEGENTYLLNANELTRIGQTGNQTEREYILSILKLSNGTFVSSLDIKNAGIKLY